MRLLAFAFTIVFVWTGPDIHRAQLYGEACPSIEFALSDWLTFKNKFL